MLYSYKWLKELSQTEKTADEVAQLLLTHSFEVEDVRSQAQGLEDVYIGHVLATRKHPDADKLNIATVNLGEEKLQIVCGAPNLAEGQKVAVAVVGAVLPGDFEITTANIRGVESAGMICAQDEIGLGDDHDGILILDAEAPIGAKLATYLNLDDTILEIDVLPNRAHDALSHRGMAREIAMLEGRTLTFPTKNFSKLPAGIPIEIHSPKCTRYTVLTLEEIKVRPSPQWLQNRLKSLGHNAINNVVDITNYVMLETGQPIHAFCKEFTSRINIRQAAQDETMTLLDDTCITLSDEDLVITDGTVPIALAGIMGGKGSAITQNTTAVVLEVAHFDARCVRASKSRHNLQTDAAYRFERDIDPNLVDEALQCASILFEEICGANLSALSHTYPDPIKQWSVALPHSEIEKLLGIELDHEQVQQILTNLEITLSQKSDIYLCHIPTRRRDLTTPEDLIEEIGRIYGYEKIQPRPLQGAVRAPKKNQQRFFERKTKDFFLSQGFNEVRSYSFYSAADATAVGLTNPHVSLTNPMSDQQEYMRRTLAVGLLQACTHNQSHTESSELFEIGRFYLPRPDGLPQEKLMLGITVTSKASDARQFYTIKGIVDQYLASLNISGQYYSEEVPSNKDGALHFHPSRRALILLPSGEVIGVLGEIAKKTTKYFNLKNAQVAFCEIDLDLVHSLSQQIREFTPLQKFPSVQRDLSMIVPNRTRVADMERRIAATGTDLLQTIDLFDLYIDAEKNERSMAFRLTFRAKDRTLKATEVEEIITKIIGVLEDADATIKK